MTLFFGLLAPYSLCFCIEIINYAKLCIIWLFCSLTVEALPNPSSDEMKPRKKGLKTRSITCKTSSNRETLIKSSFMLPTVLPWARVKPLLLFLYVRISRYDRTLVLIPICIYWLFQIGVEWCKNEVVCPCSSASCWKCTHSAMPIPNNVGYF